MSTQRAPSPSAVGQGPSLGFLQLPPTPVPAGWAPRAPSYLQQQLDPLNGGDRSLGDGSGDATGQEILHEAQGLITHDDADDRSRALALALVLASARPGTATPSPSPRDVSGPLASPRSPPLYCLPSLSREGEGPRGPYAPCALAGQVLRCSPRRRPPLQRAKGARRFRDAGVGSGLCLRLGTFKGQIHVISPPAVIGNGTPCLGCKWPLYL